MKKILSLLVVAALAIPAMVSCDKEENVDGTTDTTQTTPTDITDTTQTAIEASANTLVYNGIVYQMESSYRYEQSGRVYIDANAVDTTSQGVPIFHIISDNPDNGTYDLTQGGIFFGLSSEVEAIPTFSAQESCFSEGTLVVATDSVAFSAKLNGTLKEGGKVSYWIYVPVTEWEELEW